MASKTLEGVYEIPEGTETIDDNAFWGCAYVEEIKIPETVTRIGNEAFARCMSLKKLVIPASVKTLGYNPFIDLNSHVVDCQSPHFVIENKLLYSADQKTLIACLTDAAMVIIPKTVEQISDFAFTRRRNLKKVVIPDTVKAIGSDAFSDCDSLEEIVIPASVSTIEGHAFAYCDKLKKITFLGVVEHVARTTISNCESLKKIIVPEGASKHYIKQLHVPLELEDIVIENVKKGDKHVEVSEE